LKNLARELKIPILAISQLSRAVEQRGSKKPQLSDLRESGCLAGDSLIMRADTGALMKMEDLAKRKIQTPILVYSLDGKWKLSIRKLIKAFSSGRKQVFELKTQSGRTIKASANHPFRKIDKWISLDKLKTNDKIVVPNKLILNSEISWDKIVAIEPLGIEEVYDATVEGTHNFIANDIIVHNSIEQDADVVMFLYQEDDNEDLLNQSKKLIKLYIAKHRNGPTGEIELMFRGDRVKFYGTEVSGQTST